MSTRGFISFAVDGETKTAYNHCDSYPAGLGLGVLEFARGIEDFDAAKVQAQALRVVTDDDPGPDDGYVAALAEFYNPNVGGRSERPTWYQVLRGTQGNPGAMLRAGVIEDASDFPADSLFAEYGYVIDFDAQVLEVYRGFQKEPHNKGRFASPESDRGYYPVALVASWPLSDLPGDVAFLTAIDEGEDDE